MGKELLIVDGHALAYRTYYAMFRNPLINSKGINTSAVVGFANYLIRLLKNFPEGTIVVTFDASGPSFRKEVYTEYKANRSAMPDDLRFQIPMLYKLVEVLGFPFFSQQGYEADDIIGYLAKFGEAHDHDVKIVSKDKDLMQLVTDKIHLYAPESGGKFTEFGPAEVEEKMGVPPEKIVDLLALMGDTADNIPGLPGVGPKTALKLLESCGTVEALLDDSSLAHTPKIAKKVDEHKSELELSYKLVQLATEVPIEVTPEDLNRKEVIIDQAIPFFKDIEYESILNNRFLFTSNEQELLFQDEPEAQGFTSEVIIVDTEEKLDALITELDSVEMISLDTETTSLECRSAELVGISIAVTTEKGWYIPLGHTAGQNLDIKVALEKLKPYLEEKLALLGQNLKYDYQIFKNYDVELGNIAFDTMLAAYVINPTAQRFGMDDLAERYLDWQTIHIEELIGKGKKAILFSDVPIETAAPYAVEDVIVPLHLKEKFEPQLKEQNLEELFYNIEMPLVPVLAEMEYAGVHINERRLDELSLEYQEIVNHMAEKIYTYAGEEFNLNSPKQLGTILFEKLGLPKGKKTKTGYSTNVAVLETLAPDYPIVNSILLYREKQKLLSTYVNALPEKINEKSGRVHTSFNQTGTATGRLSSTNPNLQNIPVRTEDGRKIREAFCAEEGKVLIAADYSQIELRLLAHFSEDPVLVDAFQNDLDIHRQTAATVHGIMPELVTDEMRRAAKSVNFGLMYGMGPFKLSTDLGIPFKEAKRFIDAYFAHFFTIKEFMEKCEEEAKEKGYSETLLGRRRDMSDINSNNRIVREAAKRLSVNTPVQGTAADIIKVAMIKLGQEIKEKKLPAKMLLQVHDELLFEVFPEDAEMVKERVVEVMSQAVSLKVPLSVSAQIASNWSDAH